MNTKYIMIVAILVIGLLSGCDDFLDITPTGKVIAKTGEEYRALLTYEYKNFPEDRGLATLRSDEMTLDKASTNAEDYDSFFDIWSWNDDAPSATTVSFGWRRYYHVIYIANYIITHQADITQATAAEISQLVGEAHMMRAYAHFLLVNLYATPYTHCDPGTTRGIPVQLKADINQLPRSSSVEKVYEQVLADIETARAHLNVKLWLKGYNYRFSTVAADALLARVLLHMGRWDAAQAAAEAVLKERSTLENMNLGNSVLPCHYTSVESIVALEQVMTHVYKNIGIPSKEILSLYRSGDMRKNKYYRQVTSSRSELRKGGSNEYSCSFRTAEFYLTAAEAAARLGRFEAAFNHLFPLIDHRYNTTAAAQYKTELRGMNQEQLLVEILAERARELAFEGFRWFDLRRTSQPSLRKTYGENTYQLSPADARYTLRFPSEAVEANPGLELWPLK